MQRIDLNSDLAEGFGAYRCGDDAAMLSIVTSANVACGLHAGDPEIMANAFALARQNGVAVGAHPGFPISGVSDGGASPSARARSSGSLPIRSVPPPRSPPMRATASPM